MRALLRTHSTALIIAAVVGASACGRHWSVTLALAALTLSAWVGAKLHWSAGLALASTLLNTVWTWAVPVNHLAAFDPISLAVLAGKSAGAALSLLLLGVPMLLARRNHLRAVGHGLTLVCVLNAVAIIAQYLTGWVAVPGGQGGLFANPSMSGVYLAVTYPLLVGTLARTPLAYAIAALPVWALFLTHASMPIGAAAISAVVGCLSLRRGSAILPVACALPAAAWVLQGAEMLSTTGRADAWRVAAQYWDQHANSVYGLGAGVTAVMMPYIQEQANWTPTIFWNLHNDWLQILFEQGALGLVSVALLFSFTLARAWNRPALAASVAGYGAAALGNFPLHMPVHALLGLFLVVVTFKGDSK